MIDVRRFNGNKYANFPNTIAFIRYCLGKGDGCSCCNNNSEAKTSIEEGFDEVDDAIKVNEKEKMLNMKESNIL